MIGCGIVEKGRLLALFRDIEPYLFRYPAIDPKSFENAVLQVIGEADRS